MSKDPPPAPLNLSKHLPHPPWQILWRLGLKSRPCIIHECWWISISDTTLTYCWEHLCPHSILLWEMLQHMVTMETLHLHNCAPAGAITHNLEQLCTHTHSVSLCTWACVLTHNQNQKLEVAGIQELIQYVMYVLCGFHHLSYSHSLLPLALLCSPGWPYLHSATV